MTLPPKDYIAARREQLNQQIQSLNGELAILDKMEAALLPPSEPTIYREEVVDQPRRQRYDISIKRMALEVLDSMPGLLSSELLDAINRMFGVDIERTSFSPQLSRLKADEQIAAFNNRWQLTQKGQQLLDDLRREKN